MVNNLLVCQLQTVLHYLHNPYIIVCTSLQNNMYTHTKYKPTQSTTLHRITSIYFLVDPSNVKSILVAEAPILSHSPKA